MAEITLRVNGQERRVQVEPRTTLLEVLRRDLHLTGARESCGQGVCGACTVLLNGNPVSSCLTLAVLADGADILTIEGLAAAGRLHPVQEAFVEASAAQCGFCTPGMVLTAVSLLAENPQPTAAEIKDYMSGNLCRCGSYPRVIQAIQLAAGRMKKGEEAAALAGGAEK